MLFTGYCQAAGDIFRKNTGIYSLLEIDSTFCKVHQNVAGTLKKHGLQAIVNENIQLLKEILTGGEVHDSECAIALLSAVELEGKTVLADKAFRACLKTKNSGKIAKKISSDENA